MNRGRLSCQHKDACSDDRANTKRDQVQRTERPLQFVFALFVRFRQKRGHRFDRPEFCHVERFLPVFSIQSDAGHGFDSNICVAR